MRLHVAFLPSLLAPGRSGSHRRQVCLVVDVIRASTSLVTITERGASRILIAGDVASARQAGTSRDGIVLAGEEEGVAPRGFDYGNSPVELAQAPLRGRQVVFVTTNGTAAIRAVRDAGVVLVAAMRNGAAVCRTAWQEAARIGDLTVVCAGREGGFSIDDAYCAGYLVDTFLQHGSVELTDASIAALRLYRSDPDTLAIFSQSAAGRNVIRLGLTDDVAFCAERNVSDAVPALGRELYLLEETIPAEKAEASDRQP